MCRICKKFRDFAKPALSLTFATLRSSLSQNGSGRSPHSPLLSGKGLGDGVGKTKSTTFESPSFFIAFSAVQVLDGTRFS